MEAAAAHAAGKELSSSKMIGQSSVHELTPEQRAALAEQGATILLLGVPAGTTIGIDFTTYAAGDKFAGLKMIPPGLHFLSHCAASSSDRSEAPIKAGFWFTAKLGATLVRKWDDRAEEFSPESFVDAEELERFQLAVRGHEFDASTGPYPFDTHADWRALTEHLTPHALKRHQPNPGVAVAGTDLEAFDPNDEVLKADPRLLAAAKARAKDHAPPVTFSDVAERPRPRIGCANPLDRSTELAELHSALPVAVPGAAAAAAAGNGAVSARVGPRAAAVLAELELSFCLFMLVSSWTAFEQWKKLVVLLCSCDEALCDQAGGGEPLFLAFLRLFRAQLAYTPRELFTDELAKDNFLQLSLAGFFETAGDEAQVSKPIVAAAREFDSFLQRKFNWSAVNHNGIHLESGSEWGPTVVEETSEGSIVGGAGVAAAAAGKMAGDADHEARVSAAFGGLELGADTVLATAARESRIARMAEGNSGSAEEEDLSIPDEEEEEEEEEGAGAGHVEEMVEDLPASPPPIGWFSQAYMQMGGEAGDIPAGLTPPNTSWESPTAAEVRARKESLVKAAAERAAAAEEAAAESEVETDIGSTTEAENTESEVDSETESAADNRRRRKRTAGSGGGRPGTVDEEASQEDGDTMMSDDEAEEEEPAEVLAASAAEDLLYQQAEAANHLPPAMPPGNWAAESLGGGDEAASGYRERQEQASALREALAAAKASAQASVQLLEVD